MKPEDRAWRQLVTAARQAKDARDTAAPFGFSTRIAALAMAQPVRPIVSLFERFSWRALGVASLLALASVTVSYSTRSSATTDDVLSDDSTVGTLLASF